MLKVLVLLVIFSFPFASVFAQHEHENDKGEHKNMKSLIPKSLNYEHKEIHEILFKATKEKGELGASAKELAELLHKHFEKEEAYAMPPLGYLVKLSQGEVTEEMKEIISLTDKLKADLPEMLDEHKGIVNALGKFKAQAQKEKHEEYLKFAEMLTNHARTEEEILYPSAILAGEFIKMKLGKGL